MNHQHHNTSISNLPNSETLPINKMQILVKQQISYEQIASSIATRRLPGSLEQLNLLTSLIVKTQYETGSMLINGFEISAEEVSLRLLQAKHYDIELILRDMNSRSPSRPGTEQQIICALYNIIGSLRSHRYYQGQNRKRSRRERKP